MNQMRKHGEMNHPIADMSDLNPETKTEMTSERL